MSAASKREPTTSDAGRRRRWLSAAAGMLLAAIAAEAEVRFSEVSSDWQVEFRHQHGGAGDFFMIETMGSGVLVFDFDGDGDPDLVFVDSGDLHSQRHDLYRLALYRNDHQRFVDLTPSSGLVVTSYGMGGTAGDVDGDGDLDLYISGYGPNQLFRNNGDGSFSDVTAAAGVGDPLWGTSCAFADVDLDGDLDLYLTNYVDFSYDNNPTCGDQERGLRSYCHPDVYVGQPDRFYRNRGDGTFTDDSETAGFGGRLGKGLGVVFGDMNDDGWPDLYVANDMTPNFLYLNQRGDSFEDHALLSGTALGVEGDPEAGMGVDMGDLDNDGHPEIMATHLDMQTNALYSSSGMSLFVDRRYLAGIAGPSFNKVGFGVLFADLDQDGHLDITVANGHIIHNIDDWDRGTTYKQQNQLFLNRGDGTFQEIVDAGMGIIRASRGLAAGDLDLDGDLDLAISNSDDRAELYRNDSTAGHWLQIDLSGVRNRLGIGAAIELTVADRQQRRETRTASSYLSQNSSTAHFGIGPARRVDQVKIRWPSGKRQRFLGFPVDRRLLVYE